MTSWIAAPKPARNDSYYDLVKLTYYQNCTWDVRVGRLASAMAIRGGGNRKEKPSALTDLHKRIFF